MKQLFTHRPGTHQGVHRLLWWHDPAQYWRSIPRAGTNVRKLSEEAHDLTERVAKDMNAAGHLIVQAHYALKT